MVYRILHTPHSRVTFFLRHFGWALLPAPLIVGAACCFFDASSASHFALLCGAALVGALVVAWKTLRRWEQLDWFTTRPRELFLTMVEEGLILESPEKGFTHYLPWQGLSYRRQGVVLILSYRGVPRALISFNGMARERQEEILRRLQHFTGIPSAPQAAVATLPMPEPLGTAASADYSCTEQQRREALQFRLRPRRLLFALCLLIMTYVSALASLLLFEGEELPVAILFALFALVIGYRLLWPFWRRLRLVPSALRCTFTPTEYYEQGAYGAWSRLRLPEEGSLVRLPHSWLLSNKKKLAVVLLDASGEELPPPLSRYPQQKAPRNHLRACLVALGLLLGAAAGALVSQAFAYTPTEGELAFRELPKDPDAATLRAFVGTHYATGELYDTPRMQPCPRRDGQGLAGYIITFTESEPEPCSEDGCAHWAWETRVLLYPDGGVHDHESWPASWCPCEECLWVRLEP